MPNLQDDSRTHFSAFLNPPGDSDSTCWACFISTREELPSLSKVICLVASVLPLWCPWHQPWGTARPSALRVKKRPPPINLVEAAWLHVSYVIVLSFLRWHWCHWHFLDPDADSENLEEQSSLGLGRVTEISVTTISRGKRKLTSFSKSHPPPIFHFPGLWFKCLFGGNLTVIKSKSNLY